ncbi:SMC5-like protein [Podospora appendiculata]|uniref:Structural maintenance of chromosomes protein 5 n=1 Tax=Podospora appendiculata TaxID=314037 RepID=A0AAE1CGQ7_9PEZI|nr:SMC5-like protein [Podospora appendiculata]
MDDRFPHEGQRPSHLNSNLNGIDNVNHSRPRPRPAPFQNSSAPDAADDSSHLRLRGGRGPRRRDHGQDEDMSEDASEDASEDEAPPARRRAPGSRPENEALKTGFQPGAILRVKVVNFVTYEKAEFFLGPNLNMVIGPNGTGKSSLVCAICLGLGYASSVLGRASAYGEFVKHGKDEAEIEVELQKKPGDTRNSIVGLCIKREDNSRKFSINGRKTTLKEIQELMKSFRIQIDNLCQFLPQDKVAEFAGLSPVELLEKTLQAAAPQQMIQWQKDLREYFKGQKEAELSAHESNEQLRKMEARQQVLQADVEKLRERKEIQAAIVTLNKVELVVKYNEARREYGETKKRKKEAEQSLKRLQDSSAPSLAAVNHKQEYHAQIKQVVEHRKGRLRAAENAADDAVTKIEAAKNRIQELNTSIEAETTNFQAKKGGVGRLRIAVSRLEKKYENRPDEFDAAEWNTRIREKSHIERDKRAELVELEDQIKNVRLQGSEKHGKLKKLSQELENLNSQQGQLLNHLKRINSDVAKGWDWLQNNQDVFEKQVFGPPMLSCSVKDNRYSDLVQCLLAPNDFLCFTAQTKDDHKKLSEQFYQTMGLSVTIRSCFTAYSSFQPPLPRADLGRLGLDGYVTDYLEGPEPVLAMLCAEKRLHASAIALQDISEDAFERIKESEKISHFAAGKQLYRITRRREYGPGAVSTRVTQFQKGQFWSDQPVDMAEKTELRRKLDELQGEITELRTQMDEKNETRNELLKTIKALAEEAKTIQRNKNELQRAFSEWQALPDSIEAEKRKLQQQRDELSKTRARIREIERARDQAVLEQAKCVLHHQKTIADIKTAYQALVDVQLMLVEATSDLAALKEKNAELTQKLEAEKQVLRELTKQMNDLHATASQAKDDVAEFLSAADREELLVLAKDRTLEDVTQDIRTEKAKLEVIQASNPHALEEFENWAARIEKERQSHTGQEARLTALNNKINSIRSQWEPKLDDLVSQINDAFSYNFEQISCAGEVGVHKDEDFDKWAIEIKVKFRENETLQRLDQHRQSGGERAVSTIFYLMSLQSMAQAPFRVVDEINQGMDPRNERMVHERMVEIACREHTSQYFLITPKLLSGLRYDERMRVHTIVSGEHVDPEGTEKMDFSKFAKLQRSVMAH